MAAAGPDLRPLSFGEVLDRGLKLWMATFWRLLPAVLVVLVPVVVLSGLVLLSSFPSASFLESSKPATDDAAFFRELMVFYAGQLVTYVLLGLAMLLVTAAMVHGYGEAYLGRSPSWSGSLRAAVRRPWTLLLTALLYGIAINVGSMACYVGALFPYTVFGLVFPLVVIERTTGIDAFMRSWKLVLPHFWWALGILLVAGIMVFIAQMALAIPIGAAFLFGGDSVVTVALITTFVTLIAYAITVPFWSAVTTVLYYDLRVKQEGLDLSLQAGALPAPAS